MCTKREVKTSGWLFFKKTFLDEKSSQDPVNSVVSQGSVLSSTLPDIRQWSLWSFDAIYADDTVLSWKFDWTSDLC